MLWLLLLALTSCASLPGPEAEQRLQPAELAPVLIPDGMLGGVQAQALEQWRLRPLDQRMKEGASRLFNYWL